MYASLYVLLSAGGTEKQASSISKPDWEGASPLHSRHSAAHSGNCWVSVCFQY